MPKQKPSTIKEVYKPRVDNIFYIFIGKRRYDLFMPRSPYKYLLPYKQLKLLKIK